MTTLDESGKKHAYVLMCGNSAYFQHIAVCLSSLFDSNRAILFHVVVLSTDCDVAESRRIEASLNQYSNFFSLDIHLFDVSLVSSLPLNKNYPNPEVYARLFVDEYFTEKVERVIYLDGDIVVLGPIQELLDIDIGSKPLAAVPIPGSGRPSELGYNPEDGYFNSGVMILNLITWRTRGIQALLVERGQEISHLIKVVDQDVLNYCLHENYEKLDYVWNVITPFFRSGIGLGLNERDIARVTANARIVHFNGASKPWHYMCMHPVKEVYLRYLARTEYRDFRPSDFTVLNFLKKNVHRLVGDKIAREISKIVRTFHW